MLRHMAGHLVKRGKPGRYSQGLRDSVLCRKFQGVQNRALQAPRARSQRGRLTAEDMVLAL